MTDLTPETLGEWRKDAERDAEVSMGYGQDARRILALLDALAAEKAAREEAERELSTLKRSESFDVATAEARAVKAEQERDAYRDEVKALRLVNKDERANARHQCDQRIKTEARVAELEAGIARVLQPMNEWDANGDSDEAVGVLAAAIVGLRALTEKGAE